MMEQDLVTLVVGAAGVAALINDRMYPLFIPQEHSTSKRPCLVYRVDGVDRQRTACGADSLVQTRATIDAYAASYAGARALAAAVAAALDDFRGVVGGTKFSPIFLESESDLGDLEPGMYRRALNFVIWHKEA